MLGRGHGSVRIRLARQAQRAQRAQRSRRSRLAVRAQRARQARLAVLAALAALAPAVVLGVTGLTATVRADTVRNAQQPVLRALGAQRAWHLSTGRGVTVAVLDSGVDGRVADLSGSVTIGPDYAAGANPPGFHPPRLHGTYIASLIAGHGSGPGAADGAIGIAPHAHILSIRVLLEQSEPGFVLFNENAHYADTVTRGIRYAVAHGASVINMSLGESGPTREEEEAIGYAISHGVILVAAAGNNGTSGRRFTPYSYPASVPGVISVAAVTVGGRHASFSDHNASVVVSAPGVGVVGAGPDGDYLQGDGTSQASALVSGVAALIRARYPALPPELVARAIIEGTTHRPPGGYSTYTGFGEANADSALRAAASLAPRLRAGGADPAVRVGGAMARAPIKIVHRDRGLIVSWGAAALIGALGFVAALAVLAIMIRRGTRERRPSASAAGTPPTGRPFFPM